MINFIDRYIVINILEMLSIKDIMMFSMSSKYMLDIVWKTKFRISDKKAVTIILKLIRKKKIKHLNWITRQHLLKCDKQLLLPFALTFTNSLGVIKTIAQNIDYKSNRNAQIILWMRQNADDLIDVMSVFIILKKNNFNDKMLSLIQAFFLNKWRSKPVCVYRDTKRIARELSLPLLDKVAIQSCS